MMSEMNEASLDEIDVSDTIRPIPVNPSLSSEIAKISPEALHCDENEIIASATLPLLETFQTPPSLSDLEAMRPATSGLAALKAMRPFVWETMRPATPGFAALEAMRPFAWETMRPAILSTSEAMRLSMLEVTRPAILSATEAMNRSMLEMIRPVIQNTSSALEAMYRSTFEAINPSVLRFSTAIENVFNWEAFHLNWIAPLTNYINTSLSILPSLPLNLRAFSERLRIRLFSAFRNIGFCFAPSMSEDLMYQILDYAETGRVRSVLLLVWNYYSRKDHNTLQQAIEKWRGNPEYARRWQSIFVPAFNAHKRKEYALSIRTLAPEVEGIASHIVKKNPKPGNPRLGKTEPVIHHALKEAGDKMNIDDPATDTKHWLSFNTITDYIDRFCGFLEFEANYDQVHLNERRLNRHGISHGIQIGAFSATNSLRLFILLDTMYDLLQNYKLLGGII